MPEEYIVYGRVHAQPGRDFSTLEVDSRHTVFGDHYEIFFEITSVDEDFLAFDWIGTYTSEDREDEYVLQMIQANMVNPPRPPPRAPAGMTERHPNKENYYRCGEASGPGPVRGPSARRVSRRLSRRDLLLRRRS